MPPTFSPDTARADAPFDLSGRTALVTGGGQGIGYGIARGLLCAGARVVVAGRDAARLEAAVQTLAVFGRVCAAPPLDLADTAAIAPWFEALEMGGAFGDDGGIELLVNNAGVVQVGPAENLDLLAFDALMRVNVTAGLALTQAFARARMARRLGGAALCVASLYSNHARPGLAAYTIAKGAVRQMVQALAVEWASHGIRVNGLAPGFTVTPMMAALHANPEVDAWVRGRTPLGRWATPADHAGPAVFLLSDAARFITGHLLPVDGGLTATL